MKNSTGMPKPLRCKCRAVYRFPRYLPSHLLRLLHTDPRSLKPYCNILTVTHRFLNQHATAGTRTLQRSASFSKTTSPPTKGPRRRRGLAAWTALWTACPQRRTSLPWSVTSTGACGRSCRRVPLQCVLAVLVLNWCFRVGLHMLPGAVSEAGIVAVVSHMYVWAVVQAHAFFE